LHSNSHNALMRGTKSSLLFHVTRLLNRKDAESHCAIWKPIVSGD